MNMIPTVVDVAELQQRRLARPLWDDLSVTTTVPYGEPLSYTQVADRIIHDVGSGGDVAIQRLATATGQPDIDRWEIAPGIVRECADACPTKVRDALRHAADRVRDFHEREPGGSWRYEQDGVTLGQLARPVERVGIYVPGGQTPLVSSLLMAAVPARVAGVGEIVVATPSAPDGLLDPVMAAGLLVCEADRVFALGGPTAIAALALGTDSIPRVDLLCGPGAGPTVAAMARVAGRVGVVSLPGPTETLLVADETADPGLVAADLLAQAEHSPQAWPVLITPSLALAREVQRAVAEQLPGLPRRDIAAMSLSEYGGIVIARDLDDACEIANTFAPEHLCLLVRDPGFGWTTSATPAGCSSVRPHVRRSATTSPGRATSCRPADLPDGPHRCPCATSSG